MTLTVHRSRLLLSGLGLALVLTVSPLFAAAGGAMSLIPNDAVTVGVVHFSDLRSSPLSGMLFEQTNKVSTNGDAEKFLIDAGLQPSKDVDLLVFATSPVTALGTDARVLVAAEGRFNVDRLGAALATRGAVRKSTAHGDYFLFPESKTDSKGDKGAVAFLSGQLAVAGSEPAVVQALTDNASGGTSFTTASGLGREMRLLDPKATAWALVDVTRSSRFIGGAHVPQGGNGQGQALASALKSISTVAVWATDTGDGLKLGATGLSQDEETRQLLEDTVRGLFSAWRLAAQDKSPELVSVLRKFTVTNTGGAVTVSGSIPADTLKALKSKHIDANASRGMAK